MNLSFIGVQATMLGLIVTQLLIASKAHAVLKTLLQLAAVYALLGYVVRPSYQYVTTPSPRDFLYDSRLAATHYHRLVDLTAVAILGQLVFTVAIAIAVLSLPRLRPREAPAARSWHGPVPTILTSLYAAGWLGRVATLTESPGILDSLTPFATPVACLMILLVEGRRRITVVTLSGLLVGEMLWAVLFASKTPIIAVLVAALMRANLRLSARAKRGVYLALSVGFVCSFLVLQPLKGIDTATRQSGSGGLGGYSGGAALSVLERFDAMTSIADAYFLNRTWLSGEDFLDRAATSVLPQGPSNSPAPTLGQRWTREVRTVSVPYQYQDVSIAAGPTAEGYALAGLVGVIGQQLAAAGLFCLVAWGLASGGIVRRAYWAYFAFGSTLFELGLLGYLGANAKALQLALLTGLLSLLLGPPTRPPDVSGNSHGAAARPAVGTGVAR